MLTPGREDRDGPHKASGGTPAENDHITLATVNAKVDRLLLNFKSFNKKLEKNANKCCKKFLNIQSAHNVAVDCINKLCDRTDSAEDYNTQTLALVQECLQEINALAIKSDLHDQICKTRLESVEKSMIELNFVDL